MRRLPVYFVIDVSESMVGDPIAKVEEGMRTIIGELKKDPYALETVYISIIVFAGVPKTIVPLTEMIAFYPPRLSIGAGTGYGAVLRHLMNEIDRNVVKTTYDTKGDWKPIIYFMTDGNPTDDYQIDLGVWEQKWKSKTNMVVVSIGDNANPAILNKLSDNVLAFDDSDADSYKEFFKWVTGSIKAQSMKVEETANDNLDLGRFDTSKLKKMEIDDYSKSRSTDDRYAIFHGKCQSKKRDYLIKYKKSSGMVNMEGIGNIAVSKYRLDGSFNLDNNYQELSTRNSMASNSSVSTEELWGVPNCPSCGNRFALCICQCGGIFCVDGPGVHTCPNCNTTSQFGAGGGHIDLDRQQG